MQTPKNYICNFRAPDQYHFSKWKEFVDWCKEQGLDVCRVNLSLIESFVADVEGKPVKDISFTTAKGDHYHISMANSFNYNVVKPRREPFDLNLIKKEFRKSFSSILYESYILEKARHLNGEFCFRDFLEMDQQGFHRIVAKLIRKGKIMANPSRTIPRMYFLTEKLADYKGKKF